MENERYVRIVDGEPVEVVRYAGDAEALRSWGGVAIIVAGNLPAAFVSATEVIAGDVVVREGDGGLHVVRPYDFHSLYRRQPIE